MWKFWKRKSKENYKLHWEDISLDKFIRISKLKEDDDKLFNTINIIFDCDIFAEPLSKFADTVNKYVDRLEFMKEPINDRKKFGKEIDINGKIYTLDMNSLTTAQFIDFNNIMNGDNKFTKTVDLLSILLIPKGCKYGDYDLEDVKKDVLTLDIETVASICFFFKALLVTFLESFRYCLNQRMEGLNKLTKAEKKQITMLIKRVTENLELLVL